MGPRHFGLWVAALMCVGGAVRGQGADRDGGSVRLDTYVDDSFEAEELLKEIGALAERGEWAKASELVQRLFASHGRRLARVDDRTYHNLVYFLNDVVARWSPAGRAVYREMYDGAARRALERALKGEGKSKRQDGRGSGSGMWDLDGVLEVFDRYFCTSTGREIADKAYELALESGGFAAARRVCLRMVSEHPDRDGFGGVYCARLAVVAALSGAEDEAARWVGEHIERGGSGRIRWAGRERALSNLVESLASEARAVVGENEDPEWPTFGGDGGRDRAVSWGYEGATRLWRFDGFADERSEPWSIGTESLSERVEEDTGKLLVMNPVAGNGMIFVQGAREVRALQAMSGRLIWSYGSSGEGVSGSGRGDGPVAEWFAPTLVGKRLYLCIGSESVSYYGYDATTSVAAVVCLDSESGRELWRSDGSRLGWSSVKTSYGGSPLVSGGSVYVVARRRRTFGFEDCYLVRLRASDGSVVYRTHLGSASIGGFGYRRPTLSIPAMAEDTIYVATNLGSVAAVSSDSGRVRWLRLYERRAERGWEDDAGSSGRVVKPWHFNAMMVSGQRVICRPTDSHSVLSLDRSTGQVKHMIQGDTLGAVESILGVRGDRLYGAGAEVFCFDLGSNRMVWLSSLPEGSTLHGRGVLAGGKVLIPTRGALLSYGMEDGARSEQAWETGDTGGNLVALRNQLLVVGHDYVSAYGRKSEVWKRLGAAMESRPTDPVPALDLAEVAFRQGDRAEAKSKLADAMARAGDFASGVEDAVRARMFRDCLWFAEAWGSETDKDRQEVERFFGYAGRCAADTAGHVTYRVEFAAHLVQYGEPSRAVDLYQQVVHDRSLRRAVAGEVAPGQSAGAFAVSRIKALIAAHGRSVYAKHDAAAAAWFEAARAGSGIGALDRILSVYPVSRIAPEALMLKGHLLRGQGEAGEAARVFASAYRCCARSGGEAVRVLRLVADCHAESGRLDLAWRWLTKAMHEHPRAKIETNDGDATFRQYRERLAGEGKDYEIRRPEIEFPLTGRYELGFAEDVTLLDPVLPAQPESDWSRVYLFGQERVEAYESRTGRLAWRSEERFADHPELLVATDQHVVLATRHRVVALRASTGEVAWSGGHRPAGVSRPDVDPETLTSIYGHGLSRGRLVSIWDDGRAVCVELSGGELVWERRLRHRPVGAPTFDGNRITYVGRSGEGTAYCVLDGRTGALIQAIDMEDGGHVLRVHATDEGKLVVVMSRSIQGFDLESGEFLWRVQPRANIGSATVRFDLDGVYYCDGVSEIRKISLEDGSLLWESEPVFRAGMQGAEVVLDAGLLIAMSDRELCAIDVIDGRKVWEGLADAGTDYRYRFLMTKHLVAVGRVQGDSENILTVYAFDRSAEGSPRRAVDSASFELGAFDDVGRLVVRDGAVVIQNGRTLHAWTSGGARGQ